MGTNKIDLTGQKIDKLNVVEEAEPYISPHGNKIRRWKCICECGEETIKNQNYLTNKKILHMCKKCSLVESGKKRRVDYTGQRFGRLIVDKMVFENNCSMCECTCDCGNKTKVSAVSLKQGITQSCGCLQKERASEANKKYNIYDLSHTDLNIGIGYLNNGEEFYFDLEDYDKIKDIAWYKNVRDGYISGRDTKRKKVIYLSRLIMDVIDNHDVIVDHIHGSNTIKDNRKINLRIGTFSNNAMNKAIQPYNITGETGITYDSYRKKWLAFLWVNNEYKYLGYHVDKEDAIKVRKEAEEKYFGEWSRYNSRENDDYVYPKIILNGNKEEG